MADSEQAIDAMLGGQVVEQSPAEEPGEAPVNVAPTTMEELRAKEASLPEPAAHPPPPPAGISSEALEETVQRLSQRVAYLESLVQGNAPGDSAELQEIISKVDGIIRSLQGTVGYGARQSFVCSSCQNQGHVAARLNCTSCGEENWWGWWPQQQ